MQTTKPTLAGKIGKFSWLAVLALISSPLHALNCTPDSITLALQAEVNSFQADHGIGCDTIVTGLTISGADITDLTPLAGLTTAQFSSKLLIQNNTNLANLDGLSGLTSVYWMEINNNTALSSIAGLSNLATVGGPLVIDGNGTLTNVTGLDGLGSLPGGALILRNNANLTNLSGLSNLTSIGASLVIENNDALTSLSDLSGLTSVASNISIIDNNALASISGLSGIAGFSAGLNIRRNNSLASLQGLAGITSLTSLVMDFNPLLANVDGLSNLASVGNGGASLFIDNNASLTNINGLSALLSVDADVEITNNSMLNLCSSLLRLLDQVDDALPGPGPGAAAIPDVNGAVILSGNLAGCNSIADILGPVVPPEPPPHGACDSSPSPEPVFADGNHAAAACSGRSGNLAPRKAEVTWSGIAPAPSITHR